MDYRTFDASHVAMNSFPNTGNKVHVLLVEHESTDHDNIINMLRCFSYEVTSVSHASWGLSVLSKEKAQFDVVIANMSSPDSFGYQLLQLALKMNLLVVLTSNEEDAVETMRALEEGAFMCVTKPVRMQVLGYLWQHVSREKNNKTSQIKQKGMDQKAPAHHKRKVWTEWTADLHNKFIKAARYLGPGRCYPKDILELMNVPGLTRMQVASHLQKCRHAKWLPPHHRKTKQSHDNEAAPLQLHPGRRAPRARPASFGLMPCLDDDSIETPPVQQPLPERQNPNPVNFQEVAAYNQAVQGLNMGYVNPDTYLLDYGINQDYGFNMEQGFGMPGQASLQMNDVASGDAFGAPDMNFSQPELGCDYNDETWQSLVDQAAAYLGNGGDPYWASGGFQSGGYDPESDGAMF